MFDWSDYEAAAQRYTRIFKRHDTVRKTTYRGRSGRKLHEIEGLTRSEALHWLAHHPKGAALMQATDTPIDELADLLVEASQRATNKREEAPKMQNINKTLRAVGEHGFAKMIQKYANSVRLPNETQAQAFTRVFTSDDSEGQAIRRAWRVSKGDDNPHDPLNEPDDEDEREDEDDTDALAELEELGAEERRRNPKLSKAQAFTKAYTDNPALAAKERRQHRPRA